MKNLGKCLKVAFQEGRNPEGALNEFLRTYRATPHTATDISPGDFMFRHGYASGLPRSSTPKDEEVEEAQRKDQETREQRDEERNKTRSLPTLKVGDWVLTRNMNRRSKFDPLFGPEIMTVLEIDTGGAICIDKQGLRQRRHNDDIKVVTEAMAMEHPVNQATDTDKNEHRLKCGRGARTKI